MPKKASKPKARRKTNKGSPFEREIARKLSLWWSDGQADDWFWRTAGSGGRATNRAKSGKSTANGGGDICAQTKEAQNLLDKVTFELKRGYNTATISDLFDSESGGVMHKFIEQASRSASLAGTPHWAVIHKRDRRDALLITSWADLLIFGPPHIECWPNTAERPVWVAKLDDCLSPRTRIWLQDILHSALHPFCEQKTEAQNGDSGS
jgi:hypothetical protein